MFDKATKKLVQQIDPKGLIAASSPNDTKKLQPLAVVWKIKKVWFWQKTKYKPTVFKLNDLLEGEPINPVCEEEDLLKFEGEYRNCAAGSVEVEGPAVCLKANAQGTSKLSLSLGTLKKEDVNIPNLDNLTKGRRLDLTKSFFKQFPKKHKVLTLLKERILTTRECSISYTQLDKADCNAAFGCPEIIPLFLIWDRVEPFGAALKLQFGPLTRWPPLKSTIWRKILDCFHKNFNFFATEHRKTNILDHMGMCMKDSGKLQYGSKTALHILPHTVMAYSVIEMNIESDGYFDLRVESSGLESDDISENPFPTFSEVDGQWPQIQESFLLTTLKKELADAQASFCALADLSAKRRSSILLLLKENLTDRSVLSALVDRLEMLSSDEASSFITNELSAKQNEIIDTFLDLLKFKQLHKSEPSTSTPLSSYNGCQKSTANHSDPHSASELNGSSSPTDEQNGCHMASSHQNGCSTKASRQSMELMYAMQMLIDTLEELTDDGLHLLEPFCTSEGLQNLQNLVIHLTTSDLPLCKDTMPVFLQTDSEFHRVEELFKSCSVSLRKEKCTLTSEMTRTEGFLPVVLCIAIHGLASFVSV